MDTRRVRHRKRSLSMLEKKPRKGAKWNKSGRRTEEPPGCRPGKGRIYLEEKKWAQGKTNHGCAEWRVYAKTKTRQRRNRGSPKEGTIGGNARQNGYQSCRTSKLQIGREGKGVGGERAEVRTHGLCRQLCGILRVHRSPLGEHSAEGLLKKFLAGPLGGTGGAR